MPSAVDASDQEQPYIGDFVKRVGAIVDEFNANEEAGTYEMARALMREAERLLVGDDSVPKPYRRACEQLREAISTLETAHAELAEQADAYIEAYLKDKSHFSTDEQTEILDRLRADDCSQEDQWRAAALTQWLLKQVDELKAKR